MTLVISKGITLRNQLPADTEADAYIAAVEAADGQALEPGVKFAIKNFVLCCKQDGIWDAIKASCILAGARTLTGALVPLVGAAPTNFNFVAGDYNRKTGLVGNGSTKHLDSNRRGNDDPQDNHHTCIYASTVDPSNVGYGLGTNFNEAGRSLMGLGNLPNHTNRSSSQVLLSLPIGPGFVGHNRDSAPSFNIRRGGSTTSHNLVSDGTSAEKILIYCRGLPGSPVGATNARLAFYSIGESLDLALLDARVTDLINAFAAAIP